MAMGPSETYVDRMRGAKLGVYKNLVADNMAKYLVPQECGNKVGVRWASVTDRRGRGMALYRRPESSFLPFPIHRTRWRMPCIPIELPEVHYTVVTGVQRADGRWR